MNQQQLNLAVSQAAVNQGISQETLEKLLSRVSEQHGEKFAQRLLDRLVVSGGPPPGPPPSGGVAVSRETQSTPETRSTGAGPEEKSERPVRPLRLHMERAARLLPNLQNQVSIVVVAENL